MNELETYSELDIAEELSELAVVDAVRKLSDTEYKQRRSKLEQDLNALYRHNGISEMKAFVAGVEVGTAKLITSKCIQITNPEMVGKAAQEEGHARRQVTLTIPDLTEDMEAELADTIRELLHVPCTTKHEYKIEKDWKDALRIVDGSVISPSGEVLHGAVEGPAQLRVTGCDAKTVGPAIEHAKEQMTLAGYLAGGANED